MTIVKLEAFYNKRYVREFVDDIDYVSKLSLEEKEWLEVFVDAVAAFSTDAIAALAGTPERFREFYLAVSRAHDARRRDVSWVYRRALVRDSDTGPDVDPEDPSLELPTLEDLVTAKSAHFKYFRCGRCLSTADVCACPKRERHASYGPESYMPLAASEEDMLACLDIKKRIQAYDLLPYGDSPKGLLKGHAVQICLPHHLFKNAWGYVVEKREVDGAFLVEIKSRKGLKDADGTVPKQTFMYVQPNALRRYAPSAVK
jgi:hypothetical protein